MNVQVSITVPFLVVAVLLVSPVAAEEGYKGTWLNCDKTGIGFNVDKDMIGKALACALPNMMDIASIKDWSAKAIDKSHPDLIATLVHCLIKKIGYIDDSTGKLKQNGPKELKVALTQEPLQKMFMNVANDCYKKHEKSMTKEAKSFKGYVQCFEHSKLASACPKMSIKPGNKFDPSKFQMMG